MYHRPYARHTMPNGAVVMAYESTTAHGGIQHTNINITANQATGVRKNNTISTYSILKFSGKDENACTANCTDWTTTATAYQCTYSLCAKSYRDWSVVDGSIQPGTVQESDLNVSSTSATVIGWTAADDSFPETGRSRSATPTWEC